MWKRVERYALGSVVASTRVRSTPNTDPNSKLEIKPLDNPRRDSHRDGVGGDIMNHHTVRTDYAPSADVHPSENRDALTDIDVILNYCWLNTNQFMVHDGPARIGCVVIMIGDPRIRADTASRTDHNTTRRADVHVRRDPRPIPYPDARFSLFQKVRLQPRTSGDQHPITNLDRARANDECGKVESATRTKSPKPQAMPRCSQQPRCPNPVPPQERSATAFSGVTKGFRGSAHNAF